jgi:tRNA G18 (ribose-2'-O)-methylase SpoU
MPIIRIDDSTDERLADYAGVADPSILPPRGLFIAEGRFVVRRIFDAPDVRPRSLLLNDAALRALGDLVERTQPDLPVYVASADVIQAVAGFRMQRGCLAVAHRPAPTDPATLIAGGRLVLLLERVVDADNVGSIFRAAEAFAVDGVLLSPGCCDPFYRKALRTSSGAVTVVPSTEATGWPDALDLLREEGFTIVATTPARDALDLATFVGSDAAAGRVAILAGTEGHGLTEAALARADVRVRIPMQPTLDSLNVAMATGIVLQRLYERRQVKGT